MAPVRFGVVGVGVMGAIHAGYLYRGEVEGAVLGALCSRVPEKLARCAADFPGVPTFLHYEDLLSSGHCDAVLIVTPHGEHPSMIRAAFSAGMHVLVEKPLAVSLKAAHEVVRDSTRYPHLAFGMMYNQRTNPLYQKLRDLVAAGAEGGLGEISRIAWLATHWYRTDAYYDLAAWRSTWKLGGGGLLINQALHNLDLLCWINGGRMPSRVTAVVHTGKAHPIEVEDDVSALLEYADGCTSQFTTTTCEFPGTNRLEIAGSRGKAVAENNTLTVATSTVDARHFSRSSPEPFGTPEVSSETLAFPESTNEHRLLTQNFVDAVRHKSANAALLAPGAQGTHAVELANAILMAGITRRPVTLPLDPDVYESFLNDLMQSAGKFRSGGPDKMPVGFDV